MDIVLRTFIWSFIFTTIGTANLPAHANNNNNNNSPSYANHEPFLKCSTKVFLVSSIMTNCSNLGLNVVPQNILKTVRIMDMSKNFVRQVREMDFADYNLLETLNLESNLLTGIDEGSFKNLEELQALNLRNNRISNLNAAHFTGLVRLRKLDLGRNPLIHINSSTFAHLTYLNYLYLDGCSLETIDGSLFSTFPQMEHLILSYNHLTTFSGSPPKPEDLPHSLKILDVSHNPWRCDCNIQWLASFLRNSEGSIAWNFIHATPRCSHPSLFNGLSWKELHPSKFMCAPEISQPELGLQPLLVKKYGNISLRCPVTGGPRPSITWIFNGRNIDEVKQLKHRHAISEQSFEELPGKHVVRSTLSIYGLYEDVVGKYSCHINNVAGSKEMSYFVALIEEPSVKMINISDFDVVLRNKGTLYQAALGLLCVAGVLMFGVIVWGLCAFIKSRMSNKDDSDSTTCESMLEYETIKGLQQSRIYKARQPKVVDSEISFLKINL